MYAGQMAHINFPGKAYKVADSPSIIPGPLAQLEFVMACLGEVCTPCLPSLHNGACDTCPVCCLPCTRRVLTHCTMIDLHTSRHAQGEIDIDLEGDFPTEDKMGVFKVPGEEKKKEKSDKFKTRISPL